MTSWNRTRPESASCRESPPLVLRCMTLTLKPRPPPPPPQPGMVQANAQGRENVKWCRVVQHGVAHLQENLPLHLQQACYFWMFLGDCTGILVPGVYENVEAILWDVIVDRCGQMWTELRDWSDWSTATCSRSSTPSFRLSCFCSPLSFS